VSFTIWVSSWVETAGVRNPHFEGPGGRSQPRTQPATGASRLRKAIKTKGHFPNEDAARKLIYLAVLNAVPAWTRTRNWTTALLAFKIHFGDRIPN
jgi:transposase-like protein